MSARLLGAIPAHRLPCASDADYGDDDSLSLEVAAEAAADTFVLAVQAGANISVPQLGGHMSPVLDWLAEDGTSDHALLLLQAAQHALHPSGDPVACAALLARYVRGVAKHYGASNAECFQ